MHRYTGVMKYSTHHSGRYGQPANVELDVSFSPGFFRVKLDDINAQTTHTIQNKRFNYQSRDSPVDLLARDKWRSWWFDRFAGTLYLRCPRIRGAPESLAVTLICSWDPAFAVVEFQIDDTHYQLSCRPPRGVSNWSRHQFVSDSAPAANLADLETSNHEPAIGSNDIEVEPPHPVRHHHLFWRGRLGSINYRFTCLSDY